MILMISIFNPLCYLNGGDRMAQHKSFRNYAVAVYPPHTGGLYCKLEPNCVVDATEFYVFWFKIQ